MSALSSEGLMRADLAIPTRPLCQFSAPNNRLERTGYAGRSAWALDRSYFPRTDTKETACAAFKWRLSRA